MAAAQLVVLDSATKIHAHAAAWDDLWQRSEVALPVARAASVAHWIETFAARAVVRCLAVQSAGQFLAVLPLVGRRLKRLLPVGSLLTNDWAWAGDLLLDPTADVNQTIDILVAAIARLRWPLLWLDGLPLDAPRWQSLIAGLGARGLLADVGESFRVNQIAIDHDWAGYQASWSGNHRRQMGKMLRRAARDGGVKLCVYRNLSPEQVEPLLRRGFAVEDRSWKSAAGSSVLKSPQMFHYLCSEAQQLARWGQLQLTFLEHRGQSIAFEYGWNAAGVYGAAKVGYDEAFSNLTPGQLLRYFLLEQMFADPAQRMVDFLGPATEATSRWSTGQYRVGRFVANNGRVSGRLASRLYQCYASLHLVRREAESGGCETGGPEVAHSEPAEETTVETCR